MSATAVRRAVERFREAARRLRPSSIAAGLLWAALGAGILLRVAWMPYMEFKSDEYLWLTEAYRNLRSPSLTGPVATSVGLAYPPFFVYLLSLPVLVSPNPVFVASFIALLNLGGIAVLYFFLRRALGSEAALAVTALFASAAWPILFSRKIWNPDATFPFLVLAYLWFFSSLWQRRPVALWAAFGAFALASQTHMSTWFLPLAVGAFLAVRPERPRARDLAVGAAIFLASYVPYLLFHASTGFENIRHAWAVAQGMGAGSVVANVFWTQATASGLGLDYLLGREAYAALLNEPLVRPALRVLQAYAFLALAALAAFLGKEVSSRHRHENTRQGDVVRFFLLVLFTIHVSYILARIPPYPHYFVTLYPIVPLFTVLFLREVQAIAPRLLSRGVTALLLVLVYSNLYVSASMVRLVVSHPRSITGDYGPPFAVEKERWMERLEACRRSDQC